MTEILSPAATRWHVDVATLAMQMESVRRWWSEERALLDLHLSEENRDILDRVVPLVEVKPQVMSTLSIPDLYGWLQFIRSVREMYDGLVRTFEDAWYSELAVVSRAKLLRRIGEMFATEIVSAERQDAKLVAREAQAAFLRDELGKLHREGTRRMENLNREREQRERRWWDDESTESGD